MNKEYVYIDGKVIIEDENGNKKVQQYSDKTEEILVQENLIETIEERIKKLGERIKKNNISNKPYIPVILPTVIFALIIVMPIVNLLGVNTDIINTIFGSMNELSLIWGVVSFLILPLSILMELQLYRDNKHLINRKRGDIVEYEYLINQLSKEKEKLEKLNISQTITSKNVDYKVEKVNDLNKLRELQNWLILYNDLGYEIEKYYTYYQQGKLEEKLNKYYNEYGIAAIKEYLEKNGPKLVRKPRYKK